MAPFVVQSRNLLANLCQTIHPKLVDKIINFFPDEESTVDLIDTNMDFSNELNSSYLIFFLED